MDIVTLQAAKAAARREADASYISIGSQVRNELTSEFYFDSWSPDKTGNTDITAKLQNAVNTVVAAGGGTLNIGPGRYRIEGTVYIQMPGEQTPFRLRGGFVDGGADIPVGQGSVFFKPNAGDMFRLNLNADLTPYVNWYHYAFSVFFEYLTFEGTTSATTYGIRAYRSRIVMRHIVSFRLDGLMMQDRTGPAGYTDNWDNYCDQSLYEDIRFISQKHTAMSLTGCDSTVFNRISYQWPSAGAVYGIRLFYGCAVTMTGILYSDGLHNSAETLQSFVEVTGGNGFTLNGIHIEEPDHKKFFDFNSTFGISVTGLHVRFRSKTIFKFDNVRAVAIDGWNAWAAPDAGYYDIEAANNCSDITYRAVYLTTFNAGDPTLVRQMQILDPVAAVSRATGAAPVVWGYSESVAYTLIAADAGKTISMNTNGATTVTVPTNSTASIPAGTQIGVQQYGTGTVTLASAAGVTLRAPQGLSTSAQYEVLRLTKRTTDEWTVERISTVSSGSSLPSQTGNAGKFLTTNGTVTSWGTPTASFSMPRGYLGNTTYTLLLSDTNTVIDVNTSALTTVTVPNNSSVAFPVGTVIQLLQYGTGQISVNPVDGSVLLRNKLGITTNIKSFSQYGIVQLLKRSTNEWIVTGDIVT